MAYKSKTASGTPPVTKTIVRNSKGFSTSGKQLGPDTQPGSGPGAPLTTSRRIDDKVPTKTVYMGGRTPGNLNQPRAVGIVATPPGAQSMPLGSSVPVNAPHPDLAVTSKAQAVAQGDPDSGVGTTFPRDGVLGRG